MNRYLLAQMLLLASLFISIYCNAQVVVGPSGTGIIWDWSDRTIEQYSPDDGVSQVIRFRNSMTPSTSNPLGGFDFATWNGKSIMRILNENVGIGTTTPTFKLDVNGDFRVRDESTSHNAYTTFRVQGPDYANGLEIDFFGNNNMTDDVTWSYGGGPGSASIMNVNPKALALGTNNQTHLFISGTGNIGVGTTDPDSKLTVKGTVHTQEVKVDLQGAVAPDYVFKSDYNLPSLQDVEDYINLNGHLPEVPSADRMEKDGINLKEMNLLLLKKVEELTLYVIELKKEIKSIENKAK